MSVDRLETPTIRKQNHNNLLRPRECKVYSGSSELFPIHSFDNELCLGLFLCIFFLHNYAVSIVIKENSDNRLGVQILELSQNLHFKYRTFRFQQIKTIDQRNRILREKSSIEICSSQSEVRDAPIC